MDGSKHVGIEYYEDTETNQIGWCSRTHNLLRGCSQCGPECKHCFAMNEGAHQNVLRPDGAYKTLAVLRDGKPAWTGRVLPAAREKWIAPFRTRKRWLVFANSMSDPFHAEVSDELLLHFFRTIFKTPWHVWQVLTKRHVRMRSFMQRLYVENGELMLSPHTLPIEDQALIPNLWLGVTAGVQKSVDTKLPALLDVKAAVRFVSVEPLLEAVDISQYIHGIDWIIVGGESAGPDKVFRPMDDDWARKVRDLCIANDVAFWFKQRSGLRPEFLSKELDGQLWHQMPRRPLLAIPSDTERRSLIAWAKNASVPGLP